MKSSGERIYIGTHLALITEQNDSGPGAYIRGVEFNGVTGMTGNEDRDWPALDPAFGLAKRLGCDGIYFKHRNGVEFVRHSAESAGQCRQLAAEAAERRAPAAGKDREPGESGRPRVSPHAQPFGEIHA